MPKDLGLYPLFPTPFPMSEEWKRYNNIIIPPPGTAGSVIGCYHSQGFPVGTNLITGNSYVTCNGWVYLNAVRLAFIENYLQKHDIRSPQELSEWIRKAYRTGNCVSIRLSVNDGEEESDWKKAFRFSHAAMAIYSQANLNKPKSQRRKRLFFWR